MRVNALARALVCLSFAVAVGMVLSGCVIIPPPLTPLTHANGVTPVDPLGPSAPTKLAADPISVTLRGGVPIVRMCEAATVDWVTLSESLISDDLSKGYVDVWMANGYAHLARGTEFAVGSAPHGLKPTESGNQNFDFSNDYWELSLDDFSSTSKTIEQKFRAQDLMEGIWLDYKGRPASGPCELGT